MAKADKLNLNPDKTEVLLAGKADDCSGGTQATCPGWHGVGICTAVNSLH